MSLRTGAGLVFVALGFSLLKDPGTAICNPHGLGFNRFNKQQDITLSQLTVYSLGPLIFDIRGNPRILYLSRTAAHSFQHRLEESH